ncbi:hypothetical protein O1L55_05390 [Streptomyces albulus]|nr:hypothetical protein [Streptomyces noursei]
MAVSALATCLLMAGPAAPALLWPGRFLTGVGAGTLLTAGSVWIRNSPPRRTAPRPAPAPPPAAPASSSPPASPPAAWPPP